MDPGSFGTDHQEKIIQMLFSLKQEVTAMRTLMVNSHSNQKLSDEINGSVSTFLNQLGSLEKEFDYVFELLQSKHLMMEDTLKYIKQLEQEIEELKLQKP